MKSATKQISAGFLLLLALCGIVSGQNTQLTYQGSLSASGTPANGNYDFEFVLFDSLNAGNQVGLVQSRTNVAVANGTFAVKLDFGASFPGAARYLEIRVKPAGQPGLTILAPRQPIDSSPYAIKSLTADNANAVGGQTAASVANAVIAVNAASPANTPNTLVMRTANGDISGGIIFATQQYNIGANRVLGINGSNNLFVGINAGLSNTTGTSNSFVGNSVGRLTTTGDTNSFFGYQAGFSNTTGNSNTALGNGADVASGNLTFATAIGAGSLVDESNTVVLGRAADDIEVPGRLLVDSHTVLNSVDIAGAVRVLGLVTVFDLGAAGAASICRNAMSQISTCSSSIRYKSNINGFTAGLSLIDRLRPVSFNWKDGGMLDMGLVAEEVAEIEPLLVTTNKQGLIEGVKYDRIGVVLVNAVKEQQTQIEEQRKTIERQQQQIDALMRLVCATNASAEICKELK